MKNDLLNFILLASNKVFIEEKRKSEIFSFKLSDQHVCCIFVERNTQLGKKKDILR